MSGRLSPLLVRVVAAAAMAPIVAFCLMLFLVHSPKAWPMCASGLVPLGVFAAFVVSGAFPPDLASLVTRLRGWRLGLVSALLWLIALYETACLWWLFRGSAAQ